MNVVDTSGWLEFFAGGNNARKFSTPIKQFDQLIVPTICIYEISKVILRESDENHLLPALAAIQKGKIVELTSSISTTAARISLKYKLPMADSIIYTTANQFDATIWTQDVDFKDLPNVNYIAKQH
ncbi:MAG: type II toxin-antitoxin system VapC family toxin [Gammaproteobacteria bacterium]|jgi:predicted nucleic acid-binding protein|nr:type II toxin-antitoxin system VapC family toxin [Gammaproteobacteria bacterium]